MDSRLTTDFEGIVKEVVNAVPGDMCFTLIEPKRNAVIIDYMETSDGQGKTVVKKVISVECKDEHLYEGLRVYANFSCRPPHRYPNQLSSYCRNG